MPFIDVRTNIKVPTDKELAVKSALGRAIEDIPGKSERWLMVEITDGCRLHFQGKNDKPIAFIGVSVCGKAEPKYYDALTADICKIIQNEINISPENIYVRYTETDNWGWNGANF